MPRKLLILAVGLGTLLSLTTIASADHSWNGYHWRSDRLSPTVTNQTTSSLYDVPAAVAEWAALGSPIKPIVTAARKGDITVKEGFSPYWLGLAQVFVEGGHITRGEVKLNTRLLRSYPAAAADHVLCQEIGHVLGLDHNRIGDSSPNDDTCMNDRVDLKLVQYTSPNIHDRDQLNLIYNHTDVTGSTQGTSVTGGVWITVHVFPAR